VWPHKTVFDNVAYGLRIRRLSSTEIQTRVRGALEMVRLGELADRYPSEISGGQQQRVALARAIVVNPSLLLLDEPLSNLDAALRDQMRVEIRNLQQGLGLSAVYVTHDQAEAMVLADQLVIMRNGAIEQHGGAQSVFTRPRSRFVAEFLGTANLIDGRIVEASAGMARLEIPQLGVVTAYLDGSVRQRLAGSGQTACLALRAIGMTLAQTKSADGVNAFNGTVSQRIFLGDLTEYVVRTSGPSFRVQVPSSQHLFAIDEPVWLSFDPTAANIVLAT
jgi:iron(III) transport system ATP-binding protein